MKGITTLATYSYTVTATCREISVFLGVIKFIALNFSPSSSGSRDNIGRANTEHVGKESIYVGAVGARFEKAGRMEWQEMVITSEQNQEGK